MLELQLHSYSYTPLTEAASPSRTLSHAHHMLSRIARPSPEHSRIVEAGVDVGEGE